MDEKNTGFAEPGKMPSNVEAERDYYRLVAERLGKKSLTDAQDFSRMIKNLRLAEEKLRRNQEELENTVADRTAELVRSYRELNEITSRYDGLVQRIPNGVYILRVRNDGSMQFEYLSQQICRILGLDADALMHDASLGFTSAHPEDRADLERTTREATQQRIPFRWEGRFIVRDSIRWIRLEADPSSTHDSDIVWNGVLSDVTERRLTEEKLRESEEMYRLLTELAPNAITVADITANIRMVNPKALTLFGHSHESEVIDRSIFEWVSPKCMEAARTGFEELFLKGFVTDLELTLLRKDGSEFIADLNASLLRDSSRQPQLIIIVASDVTQKKHAEQELQKKNADMEQFIYTVSHDLRSPLVTVKTFLGFLENDMSGGNQERVAQDLQFIHSAADKMKLLLDELLELSRIDRVETLPVRVTLLEVVEEVLDALAGVINDRKVDILQPDTDLILLVDRPRFCQIWQNLIENAIKYCRDGCIPRIELGIQQHSGETVFFVKDNGIGIDPQYHSKIFGIFEKLDPKSPGAGLGLSMIQRIVEKSGGGVWVESEGNGKGACFFFTLPHAVVNNCD